MSRGLTIAELVQQVLYAVYKIRLDVEYDAALPQSFHADTSKFKEIVMEANFVLQVLQKEQDWNWLRERWQIGVARRDCSGHIMEFEIPREVYKVATGFNDSVRLHHPKDYMKFIEAPFTSPRSGNTNSVAMFDQHARINVADDRLMSFVIGNVLTFNRPFYDHEVGCLIETDVIRLIEPLHICDSTCAQPCRKAYECRVLTEVPDPHYVVLKTAIGRAEADPSVADRVQTLTDESSKLLSAMRENDSAKTITDTYQTIELGYTRVL